MIKAAIFDVDGVLLDSMPIWSDAGAKYLCRIGVKPEENLGSILWNMSLAEGISYLKENYQLAQSEEEISQGILEVITRFYLEEAPLKPGVKEFLEAMKAAGLPMVVATSGDRSYLEGAFARTGIGHYFQKIITCDEVGAGKTSPLIYQTAAACLGVNPENIVVFEDAIYAVKSAKTAKFQVVGMYDASGDADFSKVKEIADLSMKDFTEKEKFQVYLKR